MTRLQTALIAVLLLLTGAAVAYRVSDLPAAPPDADRPRLALLTSLPLMFGEQLSLDGGGSPALAQLERRYRVEPIAVTDSASLEKQRLLLMAHPRAQPAEALVDLDVWVRRGGRLLLLADPKLAWEGSRPLGDPLRPPLHFADTGLLGHWGLALGVDEAGTGSLRRTGTQCSLHREALVARCTVGRGRATIVADADFVMTGDEDDLALLADELRRVEPR